MIIITLLKALLLTVPRIKKAYRRKALELHPDRNYGDVENATKLFAEVQAAHEVLSDPQERAWYDSHRDAILRGDGLDTEDHFEHNVRVTTAGEIISMISKFNSSIPFTNAPNGFYGILRSTFEKLAREEEAACSWEGLESMDYPDFGEAEDDYDEVVRPFYSMWIGFATKKTFSWKDAYNYAEAPDRRVRRLMEKENRRLREEAIREFNDAIRSLVSFVRKRDKRYIPNTQSEADRQKVLRDAATAQAARSRAANEAKLAAQVVPDWAQPKDAEDEIVFSESEQSVEEHIECVICGKTFKSEKQYDSHEKSKKHIKAVQLLKREMQRENKRLNLDSAMSSGGATPEGDAQYGYSLGTQEGRHDADLEENQDPDHPSARRRDSISSEESREPQEMGVDSSQADPSDREEQSNSENSGDEYASRAEVESRISKSFNPSSPQIAVDESAKKEMIEDLIDSTAATSIVSGDDNESRVKLGKAKAKRAKKAARQEASLGDQHHSVILPSFSILESLLIILQCGTCHEVFASKTKLFNHIKEDGHAQPVTQATKEGKGKGKKR